MTNIPQESITPYDSSLKSWPQSGKIEFQSFNLRYRHDTDLALKDLNFIVEASQKIGVVGRTGAGKSTLSLALSRIVEADSGAILIDGVNIADISLSNLREKITIIPQDPTLFEGTLRFNIDPEGSKSDELLLNLIEQASLSDLVLRNDQGLYQQIENRGSNLSSGEKQLICICRAILRNSSIIISLFLAWIKITK